MSLVPLKCPSCGADMEVDSGKEFLFCQFCGSKIMVQEEIQKVEVTHSGSVELNTDKQRDNFLALADHDFETGNFISAYNYYTKALECDMTLWRAKLLRGVCAASIVDDDGFKSREIISAVKEVRADTSLGDDDKIEVFDRVFEFVNAALNTAVSLKGDKNIISSSAVAKIYYDILYCIGEVSVLLVEYIDAPFMEKRKDIEDPRRRYITKAIESCRLALKPVTYHVGTKNVKKGDKIIEQDVNDKMGTPDVKVLNGYIDKLVEQYNNSPSTVAGIKNFDFEIDKCQVTIDEYNNALADFFKSNPELEKTYKHPGLFGAKKKIASVEERFPQDLLAKKQAWAQAGKAKADAVGKKTAFIKQNIIK